MNLPNKITLVRLMLIPVLVVLFLVRFPYHIVAATAVFTVAAVTDWLDGHLARKLGLVTDLGKFLDTTADKCLIAVALVLAVVTALGGNSCLPDALYSASSVSMVVFAAVIVCRELMMTCFRSIAATKNVVLAADMFGKVKMTVQLIGLIFFLPYAEIGAANELAGQIFFGVGFICMIAATVLTVASALHYLIANRSVFEN